MASPRRVYVNNALNRALGRVGQPYGRRASSRTSLHRSSSSSSRASQALSLAKARAMSDAELMRLERTALEKLAHKAIKEHGVRFRMPWSAHTKKDFVAYIRKRKAAAERPAAASEKKQSKKQQLERALARLSPRVAARIRKARRQSEAQLVKVPRAELLQVAQELTAVYGRRYRMQWKDHAVRDLVKLIKQ